MFMFQYSQPDEFFRLSARRNFELFCTFGFGGYMSENNQFAIGISKDIIIPLFAKIYFGAGLGIYIKNKINNRIGSKFTFGQKYFLGFNLNEHVSLEIFEKHISNGSITENNNGYDFLGIALSYIY